MVPAQAVTIQVVTIALRRQIKASWQFHESGRAQTAIFQVENIACQAGRLCANPRNLALHHTDGL